MRAKLLLGMLAMLWIGMMLAVGMESIVKFETPTLVRAVGFDEGRYVFSFFNKIQFVLLAAMFVLVANRCMEWVEKLVWLSMTIVLVIQVFWLFPILSRHVDLILSGIKPASSQTHSLYGLMEVAKMMLLSVLALRTIIEFGK